MDTPPFTQKFVATFGRLDQQAPHIGPFDADVEHDLRHPIGAEQIDFRLAVSDRMDMGWLMIERVDHEPEAVGSMDDDQSRI
jgi:hypothetical protein